MLREEPTSACVLLVDPGSGLVLVERHPKGVGLPGGKREPGDQRSFHTAARELLEETGVVLNAASSVLVHRAGPFLCEAFYALEVVGPLPPQPWMTPRVGFENIEWADPIELVHHDARFPAFNARVFARLVSSPRVPVKLAQSAR